MTGRRSRTGFHASWYAGPAAVTDTAFSDRSVTTGFQHLSLPKTGSDLHRWVAVTDSDSFPALKYTTRARACAHAHPPWPKTRSLRSLLSLPAPAAGGAR